MFKIKNKSKEENALTPEELLEKLPNYSSSSVSVEYNKASGIKTVDHIDVDNKGLPSYSYENGHLDKELNPTLELARKWSKAIPNHKTRDHFLKSIEARLEQQPNFNPEIKITESYKSKPQDMER